MRECCAKTNPKSDIHGRKSDVRREKRVINKVELGGGLMSGGTDISSGRRKHASLAGTRAETSSAAGIVLRGTEGCFSGHPRGSPKPFWAQPHQALQCLFHERAITLEGVFLARQLSFVGSILNEGRRRLILTQVCISWVLSRSSHKGWITLCETGRNEINHACAIWIF